MKKLIKDLKKRREEAFETIYYRYNKLLFYVAISIVKERGLAEEIVQDSFLKMYLNINQYRGRGQFKAWLVSITRNLALNELRKLNRINYCLVGGDELINNTCDVDSNFSMVLREIKQYLTEHEEQIILMHVIYGFTFKKTAEELNISVNIVKKTYYKAIKKLREYYKGEK